MREASLLRAEARESLSGKWGGAVVLTLVSSIPYGILLVIGEITSKDWVYDILSILLAPIAYSFAIAFLDNNRSGEAYKVNQLFDCFKNYGRYLGTDILIQIYTILWSLLLIVPGIIKAISYSMTPFILRDYPELKFNSAIELSMTMMNGHKWEYFYLCLTFIGWALLSLLTLGIGFLWLAPYISSTSAHFYEDVKAEYEAAQKID